MKNRYAIAAALAAACAMPAAAQSTSTQPTTTPPDTATRSTTGISGAAGATVNTSNGSVTESANVTGQVIPHEAARVKVKVAESLAATAKISGDSAFAIARRAASDSGEVSSADLQMASGRLVYQVKMLLKNKGASEVVVDAMTGEVLKDKRYGGAKAVLEHHEENKKLLDAKRDSSGTKP
jgi:uncharacterized membrane protein YkoI